MMPLASLEGGKCEKVSDSKSSVNKEMWNTFFDKVLWPDFMSPTSAHRVDWGRLCILTPYRAMTSYIQDFLHERGLDLTTQTVVPSQDGGDVPGPDQAENPPGAMGALVLAEDVDDSARPDGPELRDRTHNPMAIDCASIDSYQGQEKDLVFFFSTVSASSGPKFVANPNRLCVAFTRMRQALVVIGDLGYRTKKKIDVAENGQHIDTRAFNQLWEWFPKNKRVVAVRSGSE